MQYYTKKRVLQVRQAGKTTGSTGEPVVCDYLQMTINKGRQLGFGQSAYLAEELYIKHGMTGPKMAEAALALIAA